MADRPVGDSSLRALLLDVIEPGLDLAKDSVGVRAVYRHGREGLAVPVGHDGNRHAGLDAERVHDALSDFAKGQAGSVYRRSMASRTSRRDSSAERVFACSMPAISRAMSRSFTTSRTHCE
jgi:hypothetical protein